MIWRKYKTDGLVEQDLPGQCPKCYQDMYFSTPPTPPIGWGDYPLGGHRNRMRPNQNQGLVFQCPECFEMSVCHANDEDIALAATQAYLDLLRSLN